MPVGRWRLGRSAVAIVVTLAGVGLAGPAPAVTVSDAATLGAAGRAQLPPERPDGPEDYVARGFNQLQTPGGSGDDDVGESFGNVAMSDSGRFVVFDTTEVLLDADDGQTSDIYLIDRDPPDPVNGQRDGGYDDSGDVLVTLVSSADEVPGNEPSTDPDISADGRFVVFTSEATNLLPNDDDLPDPDVYRWDRLDQVTPLELVSANLPTGTEESRDPAVSDDGSRVAFVNECFISDLRQRAVPPACIGDGGSGEERILVWRRGVPDFQMVPPFGPATIPESEDHETPAMAGNGATVVFVASGFACPGTTCFDVEILAAYDVATDTVAALPMGGHTSPEDPSVSADGELVAFSAIGISAGIQNIYLTHRSTGAVDLISSIGGVAGTDSSFEPSISSDGRYVAYATVAPNIVGDVDFDAQVVVRDRANPLAENELVTVVGLVNEDLPVLANDTSSRPFVSSNTGRFADAIVPSGLPFVAFSTLASNLTSDDDDEHDILIRSFLSASLLDGGPADFGNVAVGTTRTALIQFQANPFGFGPVAGRQASFETPGSGFSTGPLACAAIQPGQSCSVITRYAATDIGLDENELVVEFDTNPTFLDADEAEGIFPEVSKPVLATGALDALVFEPTLLAFGDRPIGKETPPLTVNVVLRGDPADGGSSSFAEIVVTGPGAADYTINAGDCLGPGAVQVGNPCAVTVTFTPSAIGSRPAFIEFRSGGSGPIDLVEITGAGIQPRIILNPAVVHSGGVIGVEGIDWPPGERVRLSVPGLPKTIELLVDTDGTVELPTVIFRSRNFGPREVMAEVIGNSSVRLAQPVILLVQAPGANVVDIIGRN